MAELRAHILIPVYQEMKKRVPYSCEREIPYHPFICSEASGAYRIYLGVGELGFGSPYSIDPLSCSYRRLQDKSEREWPSNFKARTIRHDRFYPLLNRPALEFNVFRRLMYARRARNDRATSDGQPNGIV